MSAVARRIPFHGEWSGKKFPDTYFRKLVKVFWQRVYQVIPKERLRQDHLPSHYKARKDLLLGRLDKKVKVDGIEGTVNIIHINPLGKDGDGMHDAGKILMHELLHWLDPRASECRILHREKRLWCLFSPDQRNYVYICLFAKLVQPSRGLRLKITIPRRRGNSPFLFLSKMFYNSSNDYRTR